VYAYFMTDFLPVTLTPSFARRQYSREFKRQIVEESLTPDTSIAAVAQLHGINANLLHKWRWRYRHGEYGAVPAPSTVAAVQIVKSARLAATNTSQLSKISADAKPSGYIELFFNRTRVLVHGAPDSQTLLSVIDALRL
jgi:transposase